MRISDWSSDVCSSDLPWSSSRDARHPLPEKFPVPGSVERMGRSVLVVPWPVRLHQLLLHLRGHRFVVAEIQRIATAPGGDRLEFGRVAFQLGQRHLRLDHRSEEHTSELQSLMRISYAGFSLKTNIAT